MASTRTSFQVSRFSAKCLRAKMLKINNIMSWFYYKYESVACGEISLEICSASWNSWNFKMTCLGDVPLLHWYVWRWSSCGHYSRHFLWNEALVLSLAHKVFFAVSAHYPSFKFFRQNKRVAQRLLTVCGASRQPAQQVWSAGCIVSSYTRNFFNINCKLIISQHN